MRLPRPIARLYAGLMGYFWLPCPRCGRMFGGFEVKGRVPTAKVGIGRVTCCPPYEDVGFLEASVRPRSASQEAP